MAGHDANDQPGHQKIVIEHPSRHVVESHSEERHRNYNPANESATQGGQASGSTTGPVDKSSSPPARKLSSSSSSLSSSWDFVQVSDALPSLTISAPSIATAVQNQEAHETDERSNELTASRLLALDENTELEMGAKPSMKAKKGTATRASDDSDELMGPWVPVVEHRDPDISAVGSWADDIPRNSSELADEFDDL